MKKHITRTVQISCIDGLKASPTSSGSLSPNATPIFPENADSSRQHTPGPWNWVNGNEVHDGTGTAYRHGDTPNRICAVEYPYGDDAGQNANARLIAAAPELLEALRTLYRDVEFLIEDGTLPASARDHAAMSEARAAIQKAGAK